MTTTITSAPAKTTVEIIFYVKEDTNSPYQGRLVYDAAEYAGMTAADVEADKIAQYEKWKADLEAARVAAAAAAGGVPDQVTASQARKAVLASGLKAAVEAAVASADQATQDLWYAADTIERKNPTLLALAAAIGLSSDQLDDLFRQAATL